MANSNSVSVRAMTAFDPALAQNNIAMEPGRSIAAIVAAALPGAGDGVLDRARVWLVTSMGKTLLSDRGRWARIFPKAGVQVLILLVPGNGNLLRSALTIAVTIGAVALGQAWAAPAITSWAGSLGLSGFAASAIGSIGGALVTAGALFLGTAAINLLIPPAVAGGTSQDAEKPNFAISGWQNSASPDGVVPTILGRHRVAPKFAAPAWSEIVGDQQYVRALFVVGYGPLELSDLRLKDTPLGNFSDINVEIRQGFAGDTPLSLYPNQVIEDGLGVELRRDRIRDSAGNVVGGGPETPVRRLTASDATEVCAIFNFPSGLIGYSDTDGAVQSRSVAIRIRQRPAAGGVWSLVGDLTFTNNKREGFYRSYRWALPVRGRWEIEITRVTDEATVSNVADRSVWLALQSFRPEYPLNFDKPLAVVAMRVRATYQLNSQLDTFNLIATRIAPDFDHVSGTWMQRTTRNPASLFRYVLQGPENVFAEGAEALDLNWFEDFHDFCRLKGLKYDRIHDFEASVWDVATDVCRAGRASPRHDGLKWSGVIDRPQEIVVDHINDQNSRDFEWRRGYFEPPHALRVSFLDETGDYQQRERIIRWPGYTGDITVTEQLSLPGKTDPREIWIEARRRQYETIYRPDRFSTAQDGAIRVATRGDLVKSSFSTLSRLLAAHRATAVRGQYVTLDGYIEMDAGKAYAVRFLHQLGEGDAAEFVSVLRSVVTVPGETDSLALVGDGAVPGVGTVLHFGVMGEESLDLVVAGTEAGEQMSTVLTLLAAAPIIDQLTDAEVPPPWDGRVGSDAGADIAVPAVPRVTSTLTHRTGGVEDGLTIILEPGAGSSAIVGSFTVRHRKAGTSVWTIFTLPASDGGVDLLGYAAGNDVEFEVLATSRSGYPSPYSATITGHVAEPVATPAAPPPLEDLEGDVVGDEVHLSWRTPNSPLFYASRIWRVETGGVFAAAVDVTGAYLGGPNAAYAIVNVPGPGIWDYYGVAENAVGRVSLSLGPLTVAVPAPEPEGE